MDYIKKYYLDVVLNNYVNYHGRMLIKDYWMFFLINAVIVIILNFVDRLYGIPILTTLYSLAIILPSITAAIRRLHDTGKPGVEFLFVLIPIAGIFILLYKLAQPGQTTTNEYGPVPCSEDEDSPAY